MCILLNLSNLTKLMLTNMNGTRVNALKNLLDINLINLNLEKIVSVMSKGH